MGMMWNKGEMAVGQSQVVYTPKALEKIKEGGQQATEARAAADVSGGGKLPDEAAKKIQDSLKDLQTKGTVEITIGKGTGAPYEGTYTVHFQSDKEGPGGHLTVSFRKAEGSTGTSEGSPLTARRILNEAHIEMTGKPIANFNVKGKDDSNGDTLIWMARNPKDPRSQNADIRLDPNKKLPALDEAKQTPGLKHLIAATGNNPKIKVTPEILEKVYNDIDNDKDIKNKEQARSDVFGYLKLNLDHTKGNRSEDIVAIHVSQTKGKPGVGETPRIKPNPPGTNASVGKNTIDPQTPRGTSEIRRTHYSGGVVKPGEKWATLVQNNIEHSQEQRVRCFVINTETYKAETGKELTSAALNMETDKSSHADPRTVGGHAIELQRWQGFLLPGFQNEKRSDFAQSNLSRFEFRSKEDYKVLLEKSGTAIKEPNVPHSSGERYLHIRPDELASIASNSFTFPLKYDGPEEFKNFFSSMSPELKEDIRKNPEKYVKAFEQSVSKAGDQVDQVKSFRTALLNAASQKAGA